MKRRKYPKNSQQERDAQQREANWYSSWKKNYSKKKNKGVKAERKVKEATFLVISSPLEASLQVAVSSY